MRILLLLIPALLLGQAKFNAVRIITNPAGTTPGVIELDTSRADNKTITIQAPATATTSFALTVPGTLPATSGDCLVGSTTGVLSFAACGGLWTASGIDALYDGGGVRVVNSYGKSTLSAAIVSTSATSIFVSSATGIVNGKHIIVDSEVMLVSAINTGTGELTVSRAANFTAAATHLISAPVGTSGFIQVEQGNGGYPWRLSNGMWYPGAVPYFRPVSAGPGILDVSSNGNHDSWIDICGTDVETGITAFECMEIRTNTTADGHALNYGHIGMKSNGSGVSVRPLAINQSGQFVTIGGSTFSNSLRVQAEAVDAQGITIHGTSSPGLTLTNGTVTGYFGLATAAAKYFPDAVSGDIALRNNGNIGFTADAGTTTHLRIGGGASRFNTHITTGAASAYDIGDSTNYFQTIYAENGDFAPAGVSANYTRVRKLDVVDYAGGNGLWDHRTQGSMASNSSYAIRDNAGSRWITATRAVGGSATNYTNLYTDLIPTLRSTGGGDAVTDTVLPSLGSSGSRWGTGFIGLLDVTSSLGIIPSGSVALGASGSDWNRLWVGGVEATSFVRPQVDNGGTSGALAKRWSSTFTVNLQADGVVKLGTASTVGQVWTASDTLGTGGWAASASSSNWTVTGADLYRNSKVGIGAASAPVMALHVIGTQGAPATTGTTPTGTARFITGNSVMDIGSRASGNTWMQVTDATNLALSYGLELNPNGGAVSTGAGLTVGGTLGVTGAATLSGSLEVSGAVKLTSGAGNLKVLTSDASGNSTWQDTGPCATCVTTGASSVSIAGVKTFTGVLTGTAGGSISGGNTTVEGIRFGADSAYTIGVTATRPSNIFTYALQVKAGQIIEATGSLTVRAGATVTLENGTPGTGKVLTSDAFGNASWASPGSGGTVTSIATTSPISGGTITTTGTISCPTCYTTAGGTISGGVTVSTGTNSGITITNGTATGIMYASSALTNSIAFGTTSAHPLAVYAGNAFHTAFWPSGNMCVGCTNNTNRFEVTGNALVTGTLNATGAATLGAGAAVTGNLSFTGTLNTAISTTELGYLDGVTSSIQTQLAARALTSTTISTTSPLTGGGDLSTNRTFACATCFTTAGGTMTGNLVVNTDLSVGGDIFPSSDVGADLGSASLRFGGIFHAGGDNYGSHRTRNGANLTVLSGGAMYFDSGSSVDFSGTVTTGGSSTYSGTTSCAAGQAVKTITVSRGLVTAVTCATP